MNDVGMSLAISSIKDDIDNKLPLEQRILETMKLVRKRERDIFFMCYEVNDDLMVRTALGAVMVAGSEDDKDMIKKSLLPLRALSAAASGLPINFADMDLENIIPIMKLWSESKS